MRIILQRHPNEFVNECYYLFVVLYFIVLKIPYLTFRSYLNRNHTSQINRNDPIIKAKNLNISELFPNIYI